MLPNSEKRRNGHRWGIIASIPIFVFIIVFAALEQASAAASQYVFDGSAEPCIVGGDGTCFVAPYTVTTGVPPTDIMFEFEAAQINHFQNLNPQYHDSLRSSGSGAPGPQFDGGYGAGSALGAITGTIKWGVDLPDTSTGTTLTIRFNRYISGFSLPFFDVDGNPLPYQDKLIFQGFRDATLVTPTITSPFDQDNDTHVIAGNVVTGVKNIAPNSDDPFVDLANPGAAEATILLQFNDVINRIVVVYTSGDGAQVNPNPQAIAVGTPMQFTPVNVNAVDLQQVDTSSTTPRNVGIALVVAFLALAAASWYISRSSRTIEATS